MPGSPGLEPWVVRLELAVVVCVCAVIWLHGVLDDPKDEPTTYLGAPVGCIGTTDGVSSSEPWRGVVQLIKLEQTDAATTAAVRVLRRTGALPANKTDCQAVEKLLGPKGEPFYAPFTSRLGAARDAIRDNWWLLIPILFLVLFPIAGMLRWHRWRRRGLWPKVSMVIADLDSKATGLDLGGRMAAVLRARLMTFDRVRLSPASSTVGTDDSLTDAPPQDQLPEQAKWILGLVQWLRLRNKLTLTATIATPRSSVVSAAVALTEPTGRVTRTFPSSGASPNALDDPAQTILEARSSSPSPLEGDYLNLTQPLLAWTLFHAKWVAGTGDNMAAEVGTDRWKAYAAFLEGTAALQGSDLPRALERFSVARTVDASPTFVELRLNEAYAKARTDDVELWKEALLVFEELAAVGSDI